MLLIPTLNPSRERETVKLRQNAKRKKKSWAAVAPRTSAGKLLTKAEATAAGIPVRGFVTAKDIRQAGGKVKKAKAAQQRAANTWAGRSREIKAEQERKAKAAAAAKKKAERIHKMRKTKASKSLGGKKKSEAWREKKTASGRKRGYTRGRSYTKGTKYSQSAEPIKWSEAASASGAVYPARFPPGHPKAGEKHPKAGRPMTVKDALVFQRPVAGYLSRGAIKGFYDRLPKTATGAIDKRRKKQLAEAYNFLDTHRFGGVRLSDGSYVPKKKAGLGGGGKSNKSAFEKAKKKKGAREIKGASQQRKSRGSAWRRAPTYYKRTGKTPQGKWYYKGQKKRDYRQYWSDEPAPWQTGGGYHLRTDFRTGRGPRHRTPLTFGFEPTQSEVDELELGGFGGPTDKPGGVVKLNRGKKRRKTSRRRKARRNTPPRNKSGRFKKRSNPKGRRRARRNRRKKAKTVKVYNNARRRRRRKKKRKGTSRARNSKGRFVKRNPRKRYRRKKGTRKRKTRRNYGRKGGRKRQVRRNQGILRPQLGQLQSQSFWLTVAHVGAGMTGTALLSNALMSMGPLRGMAYRQTIGGKLGRFAVCLGSAGVLSYGAYLLRNVRLVGPRGWVNVLVGGTVYCTANLINDLVRTALVPQISVPGAGMRASAGVPGEDMGDWMELSGMGGGMGAVMSPSDLVAGESAAQPYQLGGLGSSGGSPIPLEDLRGYPGQYGGGMNDWVELEAGAPVLRDQVGMPGESF